MTILILLLVAGILTILSQWWDDRARRISKAQVDAALQETEAICRAQVERQAAFVPRHEDDPRTAGKPIAPKAEHRNRRAA